MIPLHFASSEASLYGVYHPAAEPRKRKGVLLLNPYGWEALRAHLTLKRLADRFARTGYDVLRFDYSCSGDSSGDHSEAAWSHWVDDAETALDELLAIASVQRVTVCGLRLGGLVAGVLAGRRSRDVDRVIFWEAPHTGAEFLQWRQEAPLPEAVAFPLPPRFRSEVEGLDLAGVVKGFRGHVLSVSSRDFSVPAASFRSRATIAASGQESPCWVEDLHHGAGAVPVDLLDRILEAVQ